MTQPTRSKLILNSEIEQMAREKDSLRRGIDRLTKKSTLHSFEQTLVKNYYGPLTDAICRYKQNLISEKGKLNASIVLLALEDSVLAAAALLGTITSIANSQRDLDHRGKSTEATMRHTALLIGARCRAEFFWECDELEIGSHSLAAPLVRLQSALCSRQANQRNARYRSKKLTEDLLDDEWWSIQRQLTIGCQLIELCLDAVDLFKAELVSLNQNDWDKKTRVLRLSDKGIQWLQDGILKRVDADRDSLRIPVNEPMLVIPQKWTTLDDGGYLTSRSHLIKRKDINLTRFKNKQNACLGNANNPESMTEVFDTVNALQSTGWRINQRVLTTYQRIWADENLRPVLFHPKSGGVRKEFLASILFRIDAASDLQNSTFYFPFQIDFRGRVYAVPELINNQSDDYTRCLLEFADPAPVDQSSEYWLSIHLANTYGLDKLTFQKRREWVLVNESQLRALAASPESNIAYWLGADEKWCFLAATYAWLAVKDGAIETHHPVFVDGRCNGLQHLSALSLDQHAGREVNLIGSEPNDIYSSVAEALKDQLLNVTDEHKEFWNKVGINRTLIKKPIMTTPYGVTAAGMKEQLYSVIKERGHSPTSAQVSTLVKQLQSVLEEIMPGPELVKNWLQNVAKLVTAGKHPIVWTTPSGFTVIQNYRKPRILQVESNKFNINYYQPVDESCEINTAKNSVAVVPNFVHSMDAAHLVKVVNSFTKCAASQIAVIHDSFGVYPHMVPKLNEIIRQEFVGIYSHRWLDEWKEELERNTGLHLPSFTSYGQLQIDDVRNSPYFFS